MDTKGPWLDLFGFGLPWVTGPFASMGSVAAVKDPHGPAMQQNFPLLPPALKPPVPVTNNALLGYAFDQRTSPASLALIQVHSGHLAASGDPRDWVNDGPTPIETVAQVFSRPDLPAVDWYYPLRLTIDVDAATEMRSTGATRFLGLRIKHLSKVDVPLYVIQTALGGRDNRLARGAKAYKKRSRVPSVTIVDRATTYSHLDPLLASPARNDFLKTVVPWLKRIRAR
ncbi:MAG: hypothetical protein QOK31_437, partial [Solirubrobacteraceae bacterium]|nr:hypothetical protein [Solirubrobacteraceae bacterium]